MVEVAEAMAAKDAELAELRAEIEALRGAWKHAKPLIEAIAGWECANGTVCAILPSEHAGFVERIKKAAVLENVSARAALGSAEG